MKSARLSLFISIILILTVLALIFGFYIQSVDQSDEVDDVSVLFNARDESGYPSTVHLLSKTFSGETHLCGGTVIGNGVIMTAAHCVDDVQDLAIGVNTIDINGGKFAYVTDITIKNGWNPDFSSGAGWSVDRMRNDLAIVKYEPGDLSGAAIGTVTRPSEQCNYKLVGYGMRIDESVVDIGNLRKKQSIDVCITELDKDLMYLTPETGTGICFGDSGSPVYEKGTNNVVGVISSVLGKIPNQPCSIDNKALGVRLDTHSAFIASNSSIDTSEFAIEDTATSEDPGDFDYESYGLTDEDLEEFDQLLEDLDEEYGLDDYSFERNEDSSEPRTGLFEDDLESDQRSEILEENKVEEDRSSDSDDQSDSVLDNLEIPLVAVYAAGAILIVVLLILIYIMTRLGRKKTVTQVT
jgi:V8-like Glu-specific endopeptidase